MSRMNDGLLNALCRWWNALISNIGDHFWEGDGWTDFSWQRITEVALF